VLAGKLGQPAVIGELLAGVFILPFAIHRFADGLFPAEVRTSLSAVAAVGVALFMFLVGMDLERELIRGRTPIAVSVAVTATALPLALGIGLGVVLAGDYGHDHGIAFPLFLGTALAVTAFPVLARILEDRRMRRTPVGALALTAAGIGDVLAWILLAIVLATAGAGATGSLKLLLVIPYLAVMVWVVRPLLRTLAAGRFGHVRPLPPALAGVLLSGAVTELIGLHYIFGAFLFGVLMPRDSAELLRARVTERVSHLNGVLLMPVFFVLAGLQVTLSVDASGLGVLGLILAVAIVGKTVGAFAAARMHRLPTREATTLGVLMNTRGLTELIVLSVGLQQGLIDSRLYGYLVVMALVTTSMAGPLLRLVYPPDRIARDTVPAPGVPAEALAS
jgi:Kef-type K+ transport system membrane component KefB